MRILLISFFAFLFIYPLFAQKEDFQALQLPSELTENANALVRLHEVHVDVRSLKDVRIQHRTVITVLNNAGNRLAQDYIYYDNSIRVRSAEAVIYNAAGREIRKFRRRDFKDISAVDSGSLYTDSRLLVVDYTPNTYPYTIDLTYEISKSNSFSLPDHRFVHGYHLGVERSTYTLVYNSAELSINYKEIAFDSYDITKQMQRGRLHYQAQNIQPIRPEEFSPPFSALAPKVMVAPTNFYYEGISGTIHDWNDFGKWFYNNLIAGRGQVSNRTLEEVRNLVSGVEDDMEKARIVYEYVQRNTRYISVQVGIGGVQPITAGDVDRVKYGDCKGLSNYTKALLEAVGVKAYYTHIQADDIPYDFQEDFPSIEQGNHVILAIPHEGDYKWIDCTSQTIPFGFIGGGNDNRNVLLIKPDGGEIVKTKSYVDEDNLRKTTAQYSINAQGKFNAEVQIFNQGLAYSRYGLERIPGLEQQRFYANYWGRINNLRISDVAFENNRREVTFTENLKLEAENYGIFNGDRMIFNINRLSGQVSVPPRYRNRTHPVKNYRGFHYVDEFTIKLPEGYKIESLPTIYVNDTKYGHYRLIVKKIDDHTLSYSRNFLIKEGDDPKEEYENFRDFIREANLQDNHKIVLIKK
jgi:hypothetical protein